MDKVHIFCACYGRGMKYLGVVYLLHVYVMYERSRTAQQTRGASLGVA